MSFLEMTVNLFEIFYLEFICITFREFLNNFSFDTWIVLFLTFLVTCGIRKFFKNVSIYLDKEYL